MKTLATYLAAFLCAFAPATANNSVAAQTNPPASVVAPQVSKVEPPNWWANHSLNPVRLLVRGANLHGARVTSARAGQVKPESVTVNPAGTYLFVSVRIDPAATPGDYPLQVETPGGRTVIPFRVDARLDAAKNFRGVTTDDVIYLIMPDRFADGDASNNAPADAPSEANDRKNPRGWHGGDFRGIVKNLPYLKELGVTALWLNPWYDNWNGVNRCAQSWCPSTYYHGYHAVDYYGVEDRFGGMSALRELIGKAHALGIKVIQDQVANHVVVHHPWAKDAPHDNWFHGTIEKHERNPFRNDLLLSPHTHPNARRPTLDGWFADDMPDMNQDDPEVARYEIQNALWWVGATGIDGIRQDTVQYMPRHFIRDLNAALDREYPSMWMVGEAWNLEAPHTAFFIGGHTGWDGIDTHMDSVFDFPLWEVSRNAFTGKMPVKQLRETLRYDALYPDPARITTFAGNHDVKRFMSLEGATVEGLMLHTAFILSVRGTPQLYYGEEIAMRGGDDPDNRRDFPGGFAGDARNAFTKAGRTPEEQRVFEWTRRWIALRREHAAMRRGSTLDLHFDDDAYAFARRDGDETVVLAFNRAAAPKTLKLPLDQLDARATSRLVPLVAPRGEVTATGLDSLTLNGPARAAVAYRLVR